MVEAEKLGLETRLFCLYTPLSHLSVKNFFAIQDFFGQTVNRYRYVH